MHETIHLGRSVYLNDGIGKPLSSEVSTFGNFFSYPDGTIEHDDEIMFDGDNPRRTYGISICFTA